MTDTLSTPPTGPALLTAIQAVNASAEFNRWAGYEVLSATGFGFKGSDEYCATPPQFWRDHAIEAARPDADAYLLSCANISTFPVIEEIEKRLDRPVMSSNQVVVWHALTRLGWSDRENCPGRLFDSLGANATPRRAHA